MIPADKAKGKSGGKKGGVTLKTERAVPADPDNMEVHDGALSETGNTMLKPEAGRDG